MEGERARRLAGRPWADRPEWRRHDVERAPLDDLLAVLGVEGTAPPGEAMLTTWLMPGDWEPPVMLARRGVALFLLSGALLRSRQQEATRRVDLLLAGDAIRMDGEFAAWRILSNEPALLAVVAPSTIAALSTIPGAAHALMHALLRQLELELELRSIVGIQRIEQRIVAFFGLLARRLGEQSAGGVRIPLSLQQKRIEEILSAGHTQATMAFRTLFAAGVLVHDARGWQFDASAWHPRSSAPNSPPNSLSSGPNSLLPGEPTLT